MKRGTWVRVSLLAAAMLSSCVKAPTITTRMPGDRHVLYEPTYEWFNFDYHRISGCNTAGGGQIRIAVLFPNHERSQWDLLANAVVQACTTTIKYPARGEYFAYNPPAGHDLMVVWKNVATGKFGYMVIDPDTQAVYTNAPGVTVMPNNSSSWHTWTTTGYTISMMAYNPNGTTNWLANQRGALFWFGVYSGA